MSYDNEGEEWKVSNDSDEGWQDAKNSPDDPDWWYDIRVVDLSGRPITMWSISFFNKRQYRFLPVPAREAKARERGEAALKFDMAHAMRPAFKADRLCPKCGYEKAKSRYNKLCCPTAEETVVETLYRECRRCAYGWSEKVLSDLDYTP